MNKKYELTDETKVYRLVMLHRIRALKDFDTVMGISVKAGDLGGWVASEDNLSQEGNCWIGDDARVYGNAEVYGNAWVSGDAQVYGNAWVSGDAQVYGNAWVKSADDVFWISGIRSRYGTTTFFRCKDGKIRVTCGCFYGDLDEFLAKVEKTHGDNKHGKAYKKAVELAKIQMEEE